MNVLVDTSVWSLAIRRSGATEGPPVRELRELIREGRAALLGAIRQELLSGVRSPAQFASLRGHLEAFPDLALEREDYEEAARFFNTCRARGIQGSNTDFLICAAASRRELPVLTTDADFGRYAEALPVRLHAPRELA